MGADITYVTPKFALVAKKSSTLSLYGLSMNAETLSNNRLEGSSIPSENWSASSSRRETVGQQGLGKNSQCITITRCQMEILKTLGLLDRAPSKCDDFTKDHNDTISLTTDTKLMLNAKTWRA